MTHSSPFVPLRKPVPRRTFDSPNLRWLGVALAPVLLARRDRRQEPALLRCPGRTAVSWPNKLDPEMPSRAGACARAYSSEDHLLGERRIAPTVLDGASPPCSLRAAERLLPFAAQLRLRRQLVTPAAFE